MDESGKERKLRKMDVLKLRGSGRNKDVDDKEELKNGSREIVVFEVCCLEKIQELLRLNVEQQWKPWILIWK